MLPALLWWLLKGGFPGFPGSLNSDTAKPIKVFPRRNQSKMRAGSRLVADRVEREALSGKRNLLISRKEETK